MQEGKWRNIFNFGKRQIHTCRDSSTNQSLIFMSKGVSLDLFTKKQFILKIRYKTKTQWLGFVIKIMLSLFFLDNKNSKWPMTPNEAPDKCRHLSRVYFATQDCSITQNGGIIWLFTQWDCQAKGDPGPNWICYN